MRAVLLSLCFLFALFLCSCGTSSNCASTIPLVITPANATADHTAASPANQVSFTYKEQIVADGCQYDNNIVSAPSWSATETADVQIDQQGVATCVNATPAPATVSVTQTLGVHTGKGSTSLTCK